MPRDNGNGARAKSASARTVPVSGQLIRLYADYLHEEYGDLDLLTELPGGTSQFRGEVLAGGVTFPDHDQTRGVPPGPGDDRGSVGRGVAGDWRSVGALPAA